MADSADLMPTTEDATRKTVVLFVSTPLLQQRNDDGEDGTLQTASPDSRAGPLLRVRCIVQVGAQDKDKVKEQGRLSSPVGGIHGIRGNWTEERGTRGRG